MVINVVSASEIIEMKLVSSFGSSKQTDNLLLLLCQHELVLKLVSPVSCLFKCLFSESLFWNKQTGELLLEIGPLWSFSWSQFHLAGSHILWIFNAFSLHRVEVQTDFTNCNRIWWPMWQFLRCLHREAAITQLCVHIVDWWKYNAVNVSSYQRQQTEGCKLSNFSPKTLLTGTCSTVCSEPSAGQVANLKVCNLGLGECGCDH